MIICMYDVICITNRSLCKYDFLTRLTEIAKCAPKAIILREKDLSKEAYHALAAEALKICRAYDVPCILHSFVDVAIALQAKAIHVPIGVLRSMTEEEKKYFSVLGVSCHSVEEAKQAQELGCTYITAGHIFATDCKKGVPPRGLAFLEQVCSSVSIAVYAIGGIDSENIHMVCQAGAKGGCVMSGWMQCTDVPAFAKGFATE